MKKTRFALCVVTLVLTLGGGVAHADVALGTFDFNSNQFGNTLLESDAGVFSSNNWLNTVNVDPGNPGYLTGANFNTGIANIDFGVGSPLYTIIYNTPIVNQSGLDLGIVTARFSTGDTATLQVSSDGGATFSSPLNFGPSLAVNTGVPGNYFYSNFGPYNSSLYVTGVDLLDFGILSGATINAIKITGSPELDLIRVAGFNPTTSPIPEPSTMMLLGSGLVGLVGYGRRRFKK